jgi:hypothetical protein
MRVENHGGMILTGKNGINRTKTYPSATLLITNLIRTDMVANPGLYVETPTTKPLSHDMSFRFTKYYVQNLENPDILVNKSQ